MAKKASQASGHRLIISGAIDCQAPGSAQVRSGPGIDVSPIVDPHGGDKALVSDVGLSPNSVLVVAFLPPGLLLGVLALRRCEAPWAALRRVLRTRRIYVNAMIIGLSYGAVYRAYGLGGSASGVTMILAAEAVLVVLVAAVALRERERLAAKLLASALTVVGVYLVRGPGHLP